MLTDVPERAAPPMSSALAAALDAIEPVRTRRPVREFLLFIGLSVPFFALLLGALGTRRDLPNLSPMWIGSVVLVWAVSYIAAAYVGFVPAKNHITPRRRTSWQILGASTFVVVAVGLFATQPVAGSMNYPSTFGNFVAHAGRCSGMGLGTGILPGIIALIFMRRFVPVGRTAIGLSLGAAGGALGGLAVLLHCPVAERFHVGIAHGSAIVTSAIFVAGVSQILLRERS